VPSTAFYPSHVPPCPQQKIRIRLKAFDRRHADLLLRHIIETADPHRATAIGRPACPPSARFIDVLAAPPTVDNPKGIFFFFPRETSRTRTTARIIDIYRPTAKTIDALMKLEPASPELTCGRVKL